MIAFATALLLAAASNPTVEDFDSAQRAAADADRRYRASLVELLRSGNPYSRNAALQRFDAFPALLDAAAREAVLALIDDQTALFPRECIGAEERYHGSIAQGIIYRAAVCLTYEQHTNAQVARRILARGLPDEGLTLALLEKALREPSSLEAVDEVLRSSKIVPSQPFLGQLARPIDPAKRLVVLGLALRASGAWLPEEATAPVVELLKDADVRTRSRAAMLLLLVGGEDAPSRGEAIEIIRRGLTLPDDARDLGGETVASDLSMIGPAARPLLAALTKRAAQRNAYRGWTFRALAGIGIDAAPALPAAIGALNCGEACASAEAIQFIAALGEKGRPATNALISAAAASPEELDEISAALEAIDARPTKGAWTRLVAAYARTCGEAGSIPFFSFPRDELCNRTARHLEQLAKRTGLEFRRVGWKG